MIRRSVLAKVGERNERIQHWDVVDHLLRICRDHRICFVDVPTYKMRFHEGQISTTVPTDGKALWLHKQRWLRRVVATRCRT
jgi:hypothetical protein